MATILLSLGSIMLALAFHFLQIIPDIGNTFLFAAAVVFLTCVPCTLLENILSELQKINKKLDAKKEEEQKEEN